MHVIWLKKEFYLKIHNEKEHENDLNVVHVIKSKKDEIYLKMHNEKEHENHLNVVHVIKFKIIPSQMEV